MKQPLLIPILYRGTECYQLVAPWTFVSKGQEVTVPYGLVVDGASVPKMLWFWMPPDGTHRGAALAHDWLYINKGVIEGVPVTWTRAECDQVFYDLMIEAGLSRVRAGVAYRGVRLGGWMVWHRPKSAPLIRAEVAANLVAAPASDHLYA